MTDKLDMLFHLCEWQFAGAGRLRTMMGEVDELEWVRYFVVPSRLLALHIPVLTLLLFPVSLLCMLIICYLQSSIHVYSSAWSLLGKTPRRIPTGLSAATDSGCSTLIRIHHLHPPRSYAAQPTARLPPKQPPTTSHQQALKLTITSEVLSNPPLVEDVVDRPRKMRKQLWTRDPKHHLRQIPNHEHVVVLELPLLRAML